MNLETALNSFYLFMAVVGVGFILLLLPTLIEKSIERANRKKNK